MSKNHNKNKTKLPDSLNVFDLLDDEVFLVDKEFSIIWKNKAASALVEPNDVREKPQKCFYLLNEQSYPCKGCPVLLTLRKGNSPTSEIFSKRLSRHLMVTSCPMPESDNVLVIHKNITKLRTENEVLHLVLSSLPQGVILLDTSFKIRYINTSFYILFPFVKLLSENRDLRLGLSAYAPPFPDEFRDFIFKVHREPGIEQDLSFVLTEGFANSYEVKALPVLDPENRVLTGNILIFMDVTRKVIATEIRMREKEKTVLNNFFKELSLGLSTRLKRIQGINNALQKEESPASTGRKLTSQIFEEIRTLQKIFDQLGKFHFASSNTSKIRQINLNRVVKHLVKNASSHENGLTIKLDLSRYIKPFWGDLDMIRALTRQLFESAIEDLSRVQKPPAAPRSIIIKTRMRENVIELIFKDNGSGAERFFEPFSSTRPEEATGFGLYLCKKIAKIHGGEVAVQAVRGVGTKITVQIPSIPDHPKTPIMVSAHKRSKEKKTGTAPKRVFQDSQAWIIGERDFHASLILKLLNNMSMQHLFITDVLSLEKNLSNNTLPSLILINASEKETFLGFLNILKQKKRNSLSRTLLIVPEAILPLMRGRVKDYRVFLMKKPFTIDLLMENISRLLSGNSDKD
jgi:signal transduction histidine kinase